MIVLLTGGTGYIGSHLAKRLIAEGWDVHFLSRQKNNRTPGKEFIERVTIHEYSGNPDELNHILKNVKPQIVIHLASLSPSVHTMADIKPMVESNILLGTHLVEAMVQNECYHLINTGTIMQHYEGKSYSPVSLYAATKQAYETLLQYYLETTPLKVIHLKLSNVYGKHDRRKRIFPLLKKAVHEQIPLKMSPGEQYIDLIYIDDVVEAFYIAALRFKQGIAQQQEEYTISSQHPIKLKDLVKLCEEVIGKRIPVQWGSIPYRPRETLVYHSYGKPIPNWHVKTNLYDGIKKTLSIDKD